MAHSRMILIQLTEKALSDDSLQPIQREGLMHHYKYSLSTSSLT